MTAHALRVAIARPELSGTYHLAARGETTWHGYARVALDAARQRGLPVRPSDAAIEPVVIANAAGYTDVDGAEAERERAERVNAEGPALLAAEAASSKAWLVHYSSDYVFDGSGAKPWQEGDEPAPLNVYGATKVRSERAVRDAACRHLIFRTQWLYATRRQSFLS